MLWTNIFKSLIRSRGLAIVWFTIHRLLDTRLGFGRPNCIPRLSLMILTPKPPLINTSSIKFLPTWTWITSI